MSFKASSWAQDQTTGSVGAKAVLLYLADMADEDNSCYPGQGLIASVTEQSVRTVGRHLKHLESLGLVKREARMRADGRGRTSDRYYLAIERPIGQSGDLVTNRSSETTNTTNETTNRTNGTRPIRQALAEESLEEPLVKEPLEENPGSPLPSEVEDIIDPDSIVLGDVAQVQGLCDLLSDKIAEHFGRKPRMSKSWFRDMDLLLRLGPPDMEPESIDPELIERAILFTFTHLNVSNNGFCWADQIRSPGNLRKHWVRLVAASKDAKRSGLRDNIRGGEDQRQTSVDKVRSSAIVFGPDDD